MTVADKLGISTGSVVQEIGRDDDSDEGLRQIIEERCGSELVDEDYQDVVAVVAIWCR